MRHLLRCAAMCLCLASCAHAQHHNPSRADIAFNRYYTHSELNDHLRRLASAYPDLVRLEKIGESREGREMLVATVSGLGNPDDKPAMWIDGNVHGNEIQAAEIVLYTLWFLTKEYGANNEITRLLDEKTFYLLPSVNPDGRDAWFEEAQTPHSSRGSKRPVDNDNDGLFDEDAPDDLDGDGSITMMWRRDPNGRWVRSQTDPRVFTRVAAHETGDWTWLGWEGIDNDGDGRINEDGPGGDDMNRDWPSDWQPRHIQGGAGPYPLASPETKAIAEFILARPNIAAGQSYHNAGGMILRGPGQSYRAHLYSRADLRVYDELGRLGEQLLPYYRYWVIHSDLYPVHGGFVNWLAEGLGVVSFTNELWTPGKMFQKDKDRPGEDDQRVFRDRLQFGASFTDYSEFDHPTYGPILVGGPNKWSSRNTPTFMLEEESHRNFAFTAYHADQMPVLRFDRIDVERVRGDLWSVAVEVRNDRLIPTRTEAQKRGRVGSVDLLTAETTDGAEVVAGGVLSNWFDKEMDAQRHSPARLENGDGVPGREGKVFRFLITGREGAAVTLRYVADRALDIETRVRLTDEAER